MEAAQKCLILATKATLQISNLPVHGAIFLGRMADLLGKVLDLLGIANKMAPLLCNDALSVVL
jgi:hypothetical protein